MKDEKMRKNIEYLEKSTKIVKSTYFEYGMLKCLNYINDNLDDIRVSLRDIKNHLVCSKKEKQF
ncbi:unnamed protein product [marine sediment metagenome]|uniref:Uncharacterized protein n=1 Tax=marine sediment metagenome TaxID=412755 RepID=X1S7T4_9ZZZZ